MENVILGYPSTRVMSDARSSNIKIERYPFNGAVIGDNAVIRSNSTIYCDVSIGNNLRTGHNVMVREITTMGHNVLIGTNTVIDGNVVIGNSVSMQSNVYVPTNTVIEDNVFLGPQPVLKCVATALGSEDFGHKPGAASPARAGKTVIACLP
jgi:UDP-3-O-[3-hydroxymyristoyl] glucosamine N-acyltransferase